MGIIKLNKKKEEQIVSEKENLPVKKEKKKYDNKKVVCEVEEKKNEYVSTYLLNDGTYEQIITSEASNYYDEEEKKYKSIDNELFLDGDVYKNKEGKYRFEILKPEKGNNVKISKKDSSISWEYLGKKNSRNELVLNQKLDIKNNNKKNSKVRYENIEVDSDIEYVLSGNNIKENIIVKEKSKEYEYSFMLDIKDMVLKLSSDKTKIEIYKGEEKEFEIPAPYMYDSTGEVSDEVYYEVEPTSDGKYVFSVIADSSWINDSKRVLPVTIDPQIKVESDKIITWKEEMRVVNTVDGVETYGVWEEVTHPMLRVYKGGGLEYRSIITINKSLINEYVGNIYSTLLSLKPYEEYTGTMLVNGYNVSVDTSNLSIDVISDDYEKAIDKLDIILTSNCSENIYFDVNNNPPTFTINYIENEHINHVKKTFNLANIATSELDLVTGDLVTSIPTVLSDLALGVSIYHVYKKGVDDYNLGCNFKLNLHEKLIKNEGLYYSYLDSNGKINEMLKFPIKIISYQNKIHIESDNRLIKFGNIKVQEKNEEEKLDNDEKNYYKLMDELAELKRKQEEVKKAVNDIWENHHLEKDHHYYDDELSNVMTGRTRYKEDSKSKAIQIHPVRIKVIKMKKITEQKMIDREKQIKQLEEWTALKFGDVLFDSKFDNWSINSSVFGKRINGKKQLVFLIEDDNKEKFGFYLNTQMKFSKNKKIFTETDQQSFEFNLQSNGRLDKMMKFPIRNCLYGYLFYDESNILLCQLGDIVLYKENKRNLSYCLHNENIFDYQRIPNAICGRSRYKINNEMKGEHFIPKRITVIQMEKKTKSKKFGK